MLREMLFCIQIENKWPIDLGWKKSRRNNVQSREKSHQKPNPIVMVMHSREFNKVKVNAELKFRKKRGKIAYAKVMLECLKFSHTIIVSDL